jgi:hypothetical protein
MAKKKGYSDWAVVLAVVVALLVTNLYWLLAIRDVNDRLDQQDQTIGELNAQLSNQQE